MSRIASQFDGKPIPKPKPRQKKARKPMRKVSKRRIKLSPAMHKWHDDVFEHDGGVCVRCGRMGEQAHHIRERDVRPDLIVDVMNGLCVCDTCHHKFFEAERDEAKSWLESNRPRQYKYCYKVMK